MVQCVHNVALIAHILKHLVAQHQVLIHDLDCKLVTLWVNPQTGQHHGGKAAISCEASSKERALELKWHLPWLAPKQANAWSNIPA
eukprot:1148472-Pelagomonas_calceolata.AAC.9